MKKILLIAALLMAAFPAAANEQWNTEALRRLMHEYDVKHEKMMLHLQPAMRRADVDMWIIIDRGRGTDSAPHSRSSHGRTQRACGSGRTTRWR